jgi:hypothetical protein
VSQCRGVTHLKIFGALSRVASPPERPAPPAKPFDDGLTTLARLIAREDPVPDADALPDNPPVKR